SVGKEMFTLTDLTEAGKEVTAVSWSPDGSRILTGGMGATAKVWDAKNGTQLLTLKTGTTATASWSRDGTRILTGSHSIAIVWDAKTGAKMFALTGHSDWVHASSWSPDGSRIFTGSYNTAKVWNAKTGAEVLTRQKLEHFYAERVSDAWWNPDGTILL